MKYEDARAPRCSQRALSSWDRRVEMLNGCASRPRHSFGRYEISLEIDAGERRPAWIQCDRPVTLTAENE
jgi:hypothetical protein